MYKITNIKLCKLYKYIHIYNIYTNTQIVCINRPQPLVFPFATVPMPLWVPPPEQIWG